MVATNGDGKGAVIVIEISDVSKSSRHGAKHRDGLYCMKSPVRALLTVASPRGGLGWTCPPHFC